MRKGMPVLQKVRKTSILQFRKWGVPKSMENVSSVALNRVCVHNMAANIALIYKVLAVIYAYG